MLGFRIVNKWRVKLRGFCVRGYFSNIHFVLIKFDVVWLAFHIIAPLCMSFLTGRVTLDFSSSISFSLFISICYIYDLLNWRSWEVHSHNYRHFVKVSRQRLELTIQFPSQGTGWPGKRFIHLPSERYPPYYSAPFLNSMINVNDDVLMSVMSIIVLSY